MKITSSRFGEIECTEENIVCFPEGLIGFEELHEFIVMPNNNEGTLYWIQSTTDADIAMLLTDPNQFFLDYKVVPDAIERHKLSLEEGDNCFALAVITVQPDKSTTLNLAAPILYAPKSGRAIQVILEGAPYNTRTPLPTT